MDFIDILFIVMMVIGGALWWLDTTEKGTTLIDKIYNWFFE